MIIFYFLPIRKKHDDQIHIVIKFVFFEYLYILKWKKTNFFIIFLWQNDLILRRLSRCHFPLMFYALFTRLKVQLRGEKMTYAWKQI